MRITPRGDEVKRVVAILESEEYDNADQMAKALIKEVGELLQMRDWWALTHRSEDRLRGINWGPFASTIEAQAAAEKIGIGGTFLAIKLYSPGLLLAGINGKKGLKDFCQECGHAPWLHLQDGSSRGACGLSVMCTCKKFKK